MKSIKVTLEWNCTEEVFQSKETQGIIDHVRSGRLQKEFTDDIHHDVKAEIIIK